MPPLPPDRSRILTEQRNPRSMNLHAMSVRECVKLINDEDRAVPEAVGRAADAIAAFIEAVEPRFAAGGRLIYVGAGTSGRLGVLDASECPPTFQLPEGRVIGIIAGGDASLRKSSEGREDERDGAHEALRALNLTANDTVLGIAAGGTTPYVLGALEYAFNSCSQGERAGGRARQLSERPLTAMLSCSPIPPQPYIDHLIIIETGPEVLTGSTRMKAGTATKLALNTITTTLMVRTGRIYENLMVDLRASNDKLRDRAARVIATLTGLPREESFQLLDRAGGAVKTAVVMHHRALDRASAERALHEHEGRLDRALSARTNPSR